VFLVYLFGLFFRGTNWIPHCRDRIDWLTMVFCLLQELPFAVAEIETRTIIQYETLPASTVTVPPPANTRFAAFPTPEAFSTSYTTQIPKTTAITVEEEIIREPLRAEEIDEYEVEEYEDDDVRAVTMRRNPRPTRRPPPARGWLW
jgi:hypothetical protein